MMTLSLADQEAITVVILLTIIGVVAYISYRMSICATTMQHEQQQEPLLYDETEDETDETAI